MKTTTKSRSHSRLLVVDTPSSNAETHPGFNHCKPQTAVHAEYSTTKLMLNAKINSTRQRSTPTEQKTHLPTISTYSDVQQSIGQFNTMPVIAPISAKEFNTMSHPSTTTIQVSSDHKLTTVEKRSIKQVPNLKSKSRNFQRVRTVSSYEINESLKKRVHNNTSTSHEKLRQSKVYEPASIQIEDVKPELAAQIVKHHILPMFDRRAQQLSQNPNLGSVHQELLLTEQLSQELADQKLQNAHLTSQHEHQHHANLTHLREVQSLKTQLANQKIKLKHYKSQLIQLQKELYKHQRQEKELQIKLESQSAFSSMQEQYHKMNESRLSKVLYQYDDILLSRQHQQHAFALQQVERQVLVEQYSQLFESLKQVGDIKVKSDEAQSKMELLQRDLASVKLDLATETGTNSMFQGQIKQQADWNLKQATLVDYAHRVEMILRDRLQQTITTAKENQQALQTSLEKKSEKLTQAQKQIESLNKQNRLFKQRISRLRKFKFQTPNLQICRKCNAEYVESENFNWSCRTHQSEWSGSMWWCCGKQQQEAYGCKFAKHEAKKDDDDENPNDLDKDGAASKVGIIVCQCCKQVGHRASLCQNDPNIRTMNRIDLLSEDDRISKLQLQTKGFADTMVQTTHFLKKCAITTGKEEDPQQTVNPFKRGALTFEDYNYNMYNPYILIKDIQQSEEAHQTKKFNECTKYNLKVLMNARDLEDDLGTDTEEEGLESIDQEMSEKLNLPDQSKIYFDEAEINDIKHQQNKNQFEEIFKLRSSSASNLKTLVNLVDHQPKSTKIKDDTYQSKAGTKHRKSVKRVKVQFDEDLSSHQDSSMYSIQQPSYTKEQLEIEAQIQLKKELRDFQIKQEQRKVINEIKSLMKQKDE